MRRTLPAVAVTAVAALTFTACSSSGGGSDAELVGEGTGADCVIADPVPVGAALSLTGAAASYGESQRDGLELAVKHLNSRDGVEYDLSIEDDQTDAKQGISVFETLIDQPVSVILGPTLSNGAFQAQPIANDEGVPVVAISNTADGITEQGEYIYRVSLTERQVIPQTVATAKEALGLKKVVVMYSNDDAFTESGYEVFDEALADEGVEVLDTLTFSKSDTDFRTLLTEAKDLQPDAIVVSGLIEAAVPLVTQARELGIEVPIIGGNGFNNPTLMEQAGEAAEGVVVGAAWNSASEGKANAEFKKAYQAEYGHAPDQFAAQAYTGMTVIDSAVRAGCSGEREDIKENLAGVKDLETVLGSLSILESRDAEHEAVVQIVQDGKFAVLE